MADSYPGRGGGRNTDRFDKKRKTIEEVIYASF